MQPLQVCLAVRRIGCSCSFDVLGQADVPMRSGNSHDRLVPFGVYRCTDGHVAIAAFRPEWMQGLVAAMGRPELYDDPRFGNRGPRMQHAAAFNEMIEAWTSTISTSDAVRELLALRSVPAVRVREPMEVLSDPKLRERGAVVDLKHPLMGRVQAAGIGNPIQFSKAHAQFDIPAEDVGASNAQIFGGLLKMSDQEQDELRAAGVILCPDREVRIHL